jgi:hypothetical protein
LRYPTLIIWRDLAEEAAAHGHPHISMTIVVKYGDILGKRSLHMVLCNAAAHRSNDLVRKLLEYDTLGMEWPRSFPLRNACGGGHLSTCKLLLDGCSDDGKRRLNNKAIWRAVARGGKVEILELLTKHGVPINNNFFILPTAAEFGQLDMAKYAVSQNFHKGGKKPKPRNQMKYFEKSLYFSLFRAICFQTVGDCSLVRQRSWVTSGWCRGILYRHRTHSARSCNRFGSVKMAQLLIELGATPLSEEFPGELSTLTARLHRKDVLEQLRIQLNLGKQHSRDYLGAHGGQWSFLTPEQSRALWMAMIMEEREV